VLLRASGRLAICCLRGMHQLRGKALLRATRGASLVEYIVLVGVVALAAIVGFQKFGVSLYSKVRTEGDHVVSLTEMQGGSTYCFAAGSKVATTDGARPIEQIRAGDLVLSRDERTQQVVARRATRTFVTPDSAIVEVLLRGEAAPILATPGHLFATRDRGWIPAERLASGEALVAESEAIVDVVRPHGARTTFYNFEVDETHTYFVGERRALVHNPTTTDCGGNPLGSDPASSCFVAGTMVATPDGARRIESLRAGDVVLARDERSGALAPSRVARTFVRRAPSLVDVHVVDGDGTSDTIRATPEHPFFTLDRAWVGAGALARGELVANVNGSALAVVSVTPVPLEADVYNMEIEGAHTYFVGALGAWVHNVCDIFAQLYGDPPSPPIVSSQGIGVAIGNGQINQNGVCQYQITPNGAIQPASGGSSWWPLGNTNTQFQWQYIGLMGNQPAAGLPIDPNVDYVFTDNLSGCGVAVSTASPPSLIHLPCANVIATSDPPSSTNQQWNENAQQYLTQHGYDPESTILVNNQMYGWNNESDNDPSQKLPNAYFYGVKEHGVWKFKLVTTDPRTGGLKIIPVGQANP